MKRKKTILMLIMGIAISLIITDLSGITLANPGRMLEICPIKDSFSLNEEIIVYYRLTNISNSSYEENMPHEQFGLIWDWFSLLHNDSQIKSKLSEKDYGFNKISCLKPGESVTIAFSVSKYFYMPSKELQNGYYTLKEKAIRDNSPPHLPILVLNNPLFKIEGKPAEEIISGELINFIGNDIFYNACLSSASVFPKTKLDLLRLSRKNHTLDKFKENMLICNDTFAQIMMLKEITVKEEDKELLLELMNSKDLSVRRESLRCLAKDEQDTDVKKEIEKLLPTRDEIVNDLVQEILSK